MSNQNLAAGKKLYSAFEISRIAADAFRSFGDLSRATKSDLFSEQLQERIMLAVTAVNDCPLCNYAHTEMALKAGMSAEEIRALTAGEFSEVPADEIKAILFAQHYADKRGKPDADAWNEIVAAYGMPKAKCILAAARAIMMGNAVGIPLSSLQRRMRRESADPRSNLFYELSTLLLLLPLLAFSAIRAVGARLLNLPLLSFAKKETFRSI